MYTVCSKDDWRKECFEPYFCEVVYGVFFSYEQAKAIAKEIDGVVIKLPDDKVCRFPDEP